MCIVLYLTFQTIHLHAADLGGVFFSDSHQKGNVTLLLRGTGLLKYLLFVNAYAAALYLPKAVPSTEALDDVPKRLEIQYFHPIKAKDFAKSTNRFIADNQDTENLSSLQPKIDRINALYEDIKPGDRYALTYIPGIGTELSLNGEAKGIISGRDFARAMFSIWLGEKPIDLGLKRQLLGKP